MLSNNETLATDRGGY